MKNHWLLLFCLVFVAASALALDSPRAITGTLDDITGMVDSSWQVLAIEDLDAGLPGTWTIMSKVATPSWIQSDDDGTGLDLFPTKFELTQAYPNPFNPTTTVAVNLPEASDLTVTVFNVKGQQVAELISGKLSAGSHKLVFDASHLASGLYFVQAQVPGKLNQIQKITLMK